MKRKWKWIVLILIPLVFFAAVIWIVPAKNIPVEVIGGKLPDAEIARIITEAKRARFKAIFPDLSWKSVRRMPGAIKRYHGIKLYLIDLQEGQAGIPDSVLVECWKDTNGRQLELETLKTSSVPRVLPTSRRLLPESFIMINHTSNQWVADPNFSNPLGE